MIALNPLLILSVFCLSLQSHKIDPDSVPVIEFKNDGTEIVVRRFVEAEKGYRFRLPKPIGFDRMSGDEQTACNVALGTFLHRSDIWMHVDMNSIQPSRFEPALNDLHWLLQKHEVPVRCVRYEVFLDPERGKTAQIRAILRVNKENAGK